MTPVQALKGTFIRRNSPNIEFMLTSLSIKTLLRVNSVRFQKQGLLDNKVLNTLAVDGA